MLLLAVCCGTWAEEVTYSIKTTSSVETLGVAPEGSSATFNTTYSTASQLTSGTSQTLTLSGYSGVTITKITLEMKSNTSKGAGKLSYSVDGGINYTYIIGTSSSGVKFNDNAWHGSWSTNWVDVEKEVNITPTASNFIIKIEATENSLYCSKYTLTYSTGGSQTETCATPSFTPAGGTYTSAQSVTLTCATDGAYIYYRTDGDEPEDHATDDTQLYSSPINVDHTMTIKAIAVKEGMDNSAVATAIYTIEEPTPSTGGTWELTDLADLTSTDVFVIVGNNGDNYAMTNDNGTGSAPTAVTVTVADNKITSEVTDAIKWNVSGNATDGYTFYPNGSTTTWLYCTNTNNGVRVGTNDNKTFKIDAGYLKHDGTSRYVGIYNSQDWRCYTSTDGNIANQTFTFYKYVAADDRQDATISFMDENSQAITTLTANINDMVEVYTSCNVENAQLTFESDNEDIASYEDGFVLATGVGTAVITASFAGNETYKPATATLTVTVNENRAESGLAWSANSINVDILSEEGDYELPTLTNPNNVTVSYSSSNEDVAVVDATGEILLDTSAVGEATITATFAGNNDYKPAEVSYTINIVDNREVPTFAWSESTVEIDLGATEYTLPTLTKPEGATVTYSSSDDEVALVDENTGDVVVATSAVATATITATFAGNKSYKAATASYTINIVDPNAADGTAERPYSVADVINGVATGNVYVKGFIVGSYGSGSKTNFAREGLIASNLALADDPAETDVNNTIAVQMSSGSEIRTALNTQEKPYNIGVAQIIVEGNVESYITTKGIKSVSDFAKVAEQVVITSAGMSTYYTDCALDFMGDNIYAYTVTDGTNKVTYNKVDVVPANTAVVLRSVNEGAASELIPVSNDATATATSALKGTLTDIYVTTGYVLNNGSNGVGFYKANPEANDGQGTKIAAHRAYLPATSGAKDFIGVDFDSVATAISAVETESETNNVYDLQGRKVMNPAKGLYIVNGKKVVIK